MNVRVRLPARRTGEHVRLMPAIGVREKNPFARGGARAEMAGVTFIQPTVRQNVHAHHSHARVLPCQQPENLAGAVGGTIIHDEDFQLHIALLNQTANRLFDARLLIAGGNHHGAADLGVLGAATDPAAAIAAPNASAKA